MRLWSGPPIDPTLDPITQSSIMAIRSRRLRFQRKYLRMLVSAVLMALLGAGGSMLLSGGSSSEPTGPDASNVAPADSLTPDLEQQIRELTDVARQLQQNP